MESAIVPGIYDPTLADEDLRIEHASARYDDGAAAGARGGAARRHLLGRGGRGDARGRARGSSAASIVTVFPDGAEKYLNESILDGR